MNIIKTSIQAAILTIFLFLFIFFISLFKGITLYNINFQNMHIKKIFLKIEHNRLQSNIDISSIPKNEKIKLYKIIGFVKFLKYIKKLKISAPYLNIVYNNHFLNIKYNNLNLKAYIKNIFPKSKIVVYSLKYNDIEIKNINLSLRNYLKYFFIKGFFNYKNSLIYFKGKLYPISNRIKLVLNSDNLLITQKNFIISLNDLNSKISINLNKNKIFSTTYIKNSIIKYNNISIDTNSSTISQNNENFQFSIKQLHIKKFKTLKNIYAYNIEINTNFLNYYTQITSKALKADYKNLSIALKNIQIKIPDKTSALINIQKGDIKNSVFSFLLNKIYIIKNSDKISYDINSTNFVSKRIKAVSSSIKGDKKTVLNKIISGIADNFDFKIENNKFDITNKTFTSEKIVFNGVKINNLKIDFNKKYALFSSKEYFNNKINNVLKKELNISIPLKQTGGENNIRGIVKFDKNISFNIDVISKNPILKLDSLPLQVQEANITVTPDYTSFKIKKSFLEIARGIDLFFTGVGKISYEPLILTLKGVINNFVVYPILDVKNFKEEATMDLNSLELFLKNSHVYINLDKDNIIINNLKPLLHYTPFKNMIDNGILFISFAKNIKALTYIKPKLAILYRHSNLPVENNLSKFAFNKITLNLELNKNKIILYNNFIQFFMNNNDLFLSLKNIDINLFPLEKFYYKNFNQKNTENKNIIINLKNSNILYKTHKFLSQKASLKEINNSVSLNSTYKNSKLTGYTKNGYFLLEGKNFSKEEFGAFLPKFNFFKKINLDFTLVKSPDDYYIGNVYINNAIITKLKALNNVLAFLNTIPSILSLSNPGFSSKGYKIKKGNIQYLLFNKILYIKKSDIEGENIDFFSKGYIDFNKNYINLKTKAKLKLKLKKIPVIGKGLSYLLLGKDGSIEVKMIIKGDLYNPKITKDIGKALLPNPFNLFKRVLTLPFNIF
ncbi:YhdP family protein [Lebetimonas sp. JS138]|uniref:YhdP family protein n=1 Tax=Lebetimonas sp. JS138 TaxID=990072 RepID=UPI0004645F62|nr:AsmA-like C-terminal domain-containing protein [Lebetimonas sp. JS138]